MSWSKISWLPSNLLHLSPSEGIALEGTLSGSYRELLQSFPLIGKYFIFFLAKKPEQELRIGEGLPEVLVTPVSTETCKKIPHRWRICKSTWIPLCWAGSISQGVRFSGSPKSFYCHENRWKPGSVLHMMLAMCCFFLLTEWGEGFAVLALACWTGGVAGAAPCSLPCGRCWLGWATRDALR